MALAHLRLKSHTTPAPSFLQRLGKQGPLLVPIRTTKSHANRSKQQPSRWQTDDAGALKALAPAERRAKNPRAQPTTSRRECQSTSNQGCDLAALKRWCIPPPAPLRTPATSTSHASGRGSSASAHSSLRLPSVGVCVDAGVACLRLGIPRPRR